MGQLLERENSLTDTSMLAHWNSLQTSDLQRSKIIYLCYCESLCLWWVVMAAIQTQILINPGLSSPCIPWVWQCKAGSSPPGVVLLFLSLLSQISFFFILYPRILPTHVESHSFCVLDIREYMSVVGHYWWFFPLLIGISNFCLKSSLMVTSWSSQLFLHVACTYSTKPTDPLGSNKPRDAG